MGNTKKEKDKDNKGKTKEPNYGFEKIEISTFTLGTYNNWDRDTIGTETRRHRTDIPTASFPPYVLFSIQEDYLNVRNRFLKGYTSISGEPGYFYFKVLFDFKGSPLLRNNYISVDSTTKDGKISYNFQVKDDSYDFISAEKFLIYNSRRAQCAKRYQALRRFQDLLYYITEETPWAIRSVQGLGEALAIDFNQLATQEKKFTLLFSEETTDFRLTLLNDLYRFSCYDVYNLRIIIPENLRKFNMSIIFFSVPIRWFQTPIKSGYLGDTLNNSLQQTRNLFGNWSSINLKQTLKNKNNPGYKGLDNKTVFNSPLEIGEPTKVTSVDSDLGSGGYEFIITQNRDYECDPNHYNPNESLSVHMLHFRNCEITLKSTYSTFQQGDNQRPFQTTPKWEILFQRCYQQDVSEWFDLHVGELFQNFNQGKSYAFSLESKIAAAAEQALKENSRATLIQELIKDIRGDKNTPKTIQLEIQDALNSTKSFFSKVGKQIGSTFKDMFVPRTGGNQATRLRYIKEQKLWGGSSELSSLGLSRMFERAIDNIISPINDFITLGNIYDDSWAGLLNGLMNANSAYDMVKSGLGFIGRKTQQSWLANFGNGGLGAYTDNLSKTVGNGFRGILDASANPNKKGKFSDVEQDFINFWNYNSDRPEEYRTKPLYRRLERQNNGRTISPTIYNETYYSDGSIYDLTGHWVPGKNSDDWLGGYTPKAQLYSNLDSSSNTYTVTSLDKRYGTMYKLLRDKDPVINATDALTGKAYYPGGNIYDLTGYWTPGKTGDDWLGGFTPKGQKYGDWNNDANDYTKTSQDKRYGMMYMLLRGKDPLITATDALTGKAYYPGGNIYDLTGYWRPWTPETAKDTSWITQISPSGYKYGDWSDTKGGYNGNKSYYTMTPSSKRWGMMPMLLKGINPEINAVNSITGKAYYPGGKLYDDSRYWQPYQGVPNYYQRGMMYKLYGILNPIISNFKKYNTVYSSASINPYNKLQYYASQEPLLHTEKSGKALTFSMLYGYNQRSGLKKPMIGEQMKTSTPLSGILSDSKYQGIIAEQIIAKKARKNTIDAMYNEDFLIPSDNEATKPMRGRTSLIDNMYVNNTILAALNYEKKLPYKEQPSLISKHDKETTVSEKNQVTVLSKNYQQSTESQTSTINRLYEENDLIDVYEAGPTESDHTHPDTLTEYSDGPTIATKETPDILGSSYDSPTEPMNNRQSTKDLLYRLNTLLSSNNSESAQMQKEVAKLLDKYSSLSTLPKNSKKPNLINKYYK